MRVAIKKKKLTEITFGEVKYYFSVDLTSYLYIDASKASFRAHLQVFTRNLNCSYKLKNFNYLTPN